MGERAKETDDQLLDRVNREHVEMLARMSGKDRLWHALTSGGDRPSFLVFARVLMHEMPDAWQLQMAKLLEEWDGTWTNWTDEDPGGTRVLATRGGKLIPWPTWLLRYKYPDQKKIKRLRAKTPPHTEPTPND